MTPRFLRERGVLLHFLFFYCIVPVVGSLQKRGHDMLNTITFKDGERVVLPHHGVCTFSGLIKEEISGTTMEFAVIAVDRGII